MEGVQVDRLAVAEKILQRLLERYDDATAGGAGEISAGRQGVICASDHAATIRTILQRPHDRHDIELSAFALRTGAPLFHSAGKILDPVASKRVAILRRRFD